MAGAKSLLMTLKIETSTAVGTVHDQRPKFQFMRVEWLGQTIASLCWICSMGFYGLNSIGDGLQLVAGVAWLIANIASPNDS